jgi:hypothetical protein
MSVVYDPACPGLGVRRLRVLRGAAIPAADVELKSRVNGRRVGHIVWIGHTAVVTLYNEHPTDGAVAAGSTTLLFVRDVVVRCFPRFL